MGHLWNAKSFIPPHHWHLALIYNVESIQRPTSLSSFGSTLPDNGVWTSFEYHP